MPQTTTRHHIYKAQLLHSINDQGVFSVWYWYWLGLVDIIIAIIRNASNKNANAGVDALLHEVIEIGTRRKQNIPIQEGGRNELPKADFEQQTFSITN